MASIVSNLRPFKLNERPAVFAAEIAPALLAARGPRRRTQSAAARQLLRYAAEQAFGPGCRIESIHATSISHSANLVLCGLARSGRLGVDVERIRPRRDWDGLARVALHPVEREELGLLPENLRWTGFYRAWTMKEALAKALGIGLGLPFDRILVSRDGRLEEGAGIAGLSAVGWRFLALDAGPGFAAAVAWNEQSV